MQPSSSGLSKDIVVTQLANEDGWVQLGAIGKQLPNLVADFDVRTYGFRNLSDLVRAAGIFEIEKLDGGGIKLRIKPKDAAQKKRRR